MRRIIDDQVQFPSFQEGSNDVRDSGIILTYIVLCKHPPCDFAMVVNKSSEPRHWRAYIYAKIPEIVLQRRQENAHSTLEHPKLDNVRDVFREDQVFIEFEKRYWLQ